MLTKCPSLVRMTEKSKIIFRTEHQFYYIQEEKINWTDIWDWNKSSGRKNINVWFTDYIFFFERSEVDLEKLLNDVQKLSVVGLEINKSKISVIQRYRNWSSDSLIIKNRSDSIRRGRWIYLMGSTILKMDEGRYRTIIEYYI